VSVTTYARLRMFWGALDLTLQQAQTPNYAPTQIVSGGSAATVGSGVGVRRCLVTFDRTGIATTADPCFFHFDFLNMTAGAPDDTWITSDYTGLETLVSAFCTSMVGFWSNLEKVTTFSWYRVGTGVSKPNPAERILVLGAPIVGTVSSGFQAPQIATTITFRTGVRKSWGRTYIPYSLGVTSSRRLSSTQCDSIAGAANTLATGAATNDMHLVVVSKPLASSLNVEHVEVDDVLDVQRRRRWKQSTYKKVLP